MGNRPEPLVAHSFGSWAAKVGGVFDREFRRLALIQLVTWFPFWMLTGWINSGTIDVAPVSSFLERYPIQILFVHVEIVFGGSFEATIFGLPPGVPEVQMALTTILIVAGSSVALCASFCAVTLSAAGQDTPVLTGLWLAAKRLCPLLGWSFVGLVVVIAGFQAPLFADGLLGVPSAILLSLAAGTYLTTVFAASLVGVVTFERSGPLRCFELVAGRWWPTFGRLLPIWLIAAVYEVVADAITARSAPTPWSQLAWLGLLAIPVGVLVNAAQIITYAELRRSATTDELADEISEKVSEKVSSKSTETRGKNPTPPTRKPAMPITYPTARFDRPDFDIVFDYPAHLHEGSIDNRPRESTTIRLALDPHNGVTLSREELDWPFIDREPRTIRRSIDQLMTRLAGSPVRGTSLTVGGLPALEYDFSYSSPPVPNLRSHSIVLVHGTTQYLINCESTDAHRQEMDRAAYLLRHSLRRRQPSL